MGPSALPVECSSHARPTPPHPSKPIAPLPPAPLVLLQKEVLSPRVTFDLHLVVRGSTAHCVHHPPCPVFASIVSPPTCLRPGGTPGPSAMPGDEWWDFTDSSLLGQWRRQQRQVAKVLKPHFLGQPVPATQPRRALPSQPGAMPAPGPPDQIWLFMFVFGKATGQKCPFQHPGTLRFVSYKNQTHIEDQSPQCQLPFANPVSLAQHRLAGDGL